MHVCKSEHVHRCWMGCVSNVIARRLANKLEYSVKKKVSHILLPDSILMRMQNSEQELQRFFDIKAEPTRDARSALNILAQRNRLKYNNSDAYPHNVRKNNFGQQQQSDQFPRVHSESSVTESSKQNTFPRIKPLTSTEGIVQLLTLSQAPYCLRAQHSNIC